MDRTKQGCGRASTSGLGEGSGANGGDNKSRRASSFASLTPKLKKILGINSLSSSPSHTGEPRSQSACSGCFNSKASTPSSSGSTASLPSKAAKNAEKSARKKREKEEKALEKERKRREKEELNRLKADRKKTPSPGDSLPSDSAIREYFFNNNKTLSNRASTVRSYNPAEIRAAAASFAAASATVVAEANAGPSCNSRLSTSPISNPLSHLSDVGRIYMGYDVPRGSRPSSRLNCYVKYLEEDEEGGSGNMISTKFTSFKKE